MTENEAIEKLNMLNDSLNWQRADADESSEALQNAIQTLEKQIPKKPIFTEDKQFALCPSCDGKGLFDKHKHCDNCGQKLDWSDTD